MNTVFTSVPITTIAIAAPIELRKIASQIATARTRSTTDDREEADDEAHHGERRRPADAEQQVHPEDDQLLSVCVSSVE
jgi:hypothetical protein